MTTEVRQPDWHTGYDKKYTVQGGPNQMRRIG